MGSLAGQKILITGGCGSIGSELVSQVLTRDPAVVRVFDNDETALFTLKSSYQNDSRLRFLLGDIRDRERLRMAIKDIDVVFHAAAVKHVALTEYNPFEAVKTNIQGTENLIRVALEEGVESFTTISTDKASHPVSVMGATKLLSERLVVAANSYKGDQETEFGVVRFGNVLGSNGSVVPIFLRQIRDGGPVTVTDPEMTRFIMPTNQAVNLVLRAHNRIANGEVLVLKMPTFRVGTLAEAMIEQYASDFDYSPEDIPIDIVGTRPAERTHEKLITADETTQAYELEDMYAILPQIDVWGYEPETYTDADPVEEEYTSADKTPLSGDELIAMIENSNLLSRFKSKS